MARPTNKENPMTDTATDTLPWTEWSDKVTEATRLVAAVVAELLDLGDLIWLQETLDDARDRLQAAVTAPRPRRPGP